MRNSRGGLGGTPSPGRAGAPQASARSRQAKATERASGLQDRPSRRRVIAVCRALPWCDLTPKRKRPEDFANWRGRYWCPCREQRPTVSGGAPHPNAAHQTSHLSLARAIGKPKFNISSVIVFAWIFDFYAHASDKWDVSENQSGAGH